MRPDEIALAEVDKVKDKSVKRDTCLWIHDHDTARVLFHEDVLCSSGLDARLKERPMLRLRALFATELPVRVGDYGSFH